MSQVSKFIPPSLPILKTVSPSGADWLHEVKFDGWRVQFHKVGDRVTLFSRSGNDFTSRFPQIRDSVIALPCESAIIDAEIVACDSDGQPDFHALMSRKIEGVCAWCFDMMAINARDMREQPLLARRATLRKLLIKADDDTLRFSENFPDPLKLLAVVEKMGLEGVVSKDAAQHYVSGRNASWVKVKSKAWREANKNRWELFERRGRPRDE